MADTRPRRFLHYWTPLLFSVILIGGMILGFNLRDTLRNKRNITTIIERNDRLEQIIDLIREKYVDTVNTNNLYDDAVAGILSHLDPHTVYIPPNEVSSVNEDLDGSFSGIGVEFSIEEDTIQVTNVIEGGPSEKVGIEPGDQIIRVGDSIIAGVKITTDRIIHMLRGKEHSKVVVTMRSPQDGKLRNIIIERGTVPLYSIEANLMLKANTGYIKINRFSATTAEEFKRALLDLITKGATQMIIDLRQNPGGYLDVATSLADELLGGNKLIVYTQGRNAPRKNYRAEQQGAFETGRLAILVDEGSASASEVLTGAIQDWDRGIVVGRRTFGKGLVQEQFELEDGAAIRLTIARYYTPSGRSIQRTYASGKADYQSEIENRIYQELHEGRDQTQASDTVKYYTAKKRTVYAGGGILPDVYVPFDTARLNSVLTNILYSDAMKSAIWDYFVRNKMALRQYPSWLHYNALFDVAPIIQTFLNGEPERNRLAFTRAMGATDQRDYFMTMVKAQLARLVFRNNGYYGVASSKDQTIQAALLHLEPARYSALIRGN